MEREHMRELLATLGMGWERRKDTFHEYYLWYDKHGGYRGECDRWRPDTDWRQCGLVIEAMQAKEWEFKLTWDGTMAVAAFQKEWGLYHAMVENAILAGVCYAVSVAAARALEATDA